MPSRCCWFVELGTFEDFEWNLIDPRGSKGHLDSFRINLESFRIPMLTSDKKKPDHRSTLLYTAMVRFFSYQTLQTSNYSQNLSYLITSLLDIFGKILTLLQNQNPFIVIFVKQISIGFHSSQFCNYFVGITLVHQKSLSFPRKSHFSCVLTDQSVEISIEFFC